MSLVIPVSCVMCNVEWASRVDERFPPFDFRGAVGNDRGNLGDAVAG